MPGFDLKFIGSAEEIPDLLVSCDLSVARGDVIPPAGPITEVVNRAPASYRALQANDFFISKWWHAKGAAAPAYDPTVFNGTGGANFTLSGQSLKITDADAPVYPASSFTILGISQHAAGSGPGQVFLQIGSGNIGLSVDDPNFAGHLAYEDLIGGVDTGIPATSGIHFDVLVLNAATPGSKWYRDASLTPIYSGVYTPSAYGGSAFGGYIGGTDPISLGYMVGKIGKVALYRRALTLAEVAFILQVESLRFNTPKFVGTYQHVAPEFVSFTDPPSLAGDPSRISTTAGHTERYMRFRRGAYDVVDVLVMALVGGTVDPTATGLDGSYVPHFVEWPFMSTVGPPQIFTQAGDPSGVCRLRLRDTGRYLFCMYKPGAGMQLVHFNLEP